ncbi:MAG: riboflavin kinase [Bryobacterales bacterium]
MSSSRVRTALNEGRLREARRLLGAPYCMRGVVARGRGIGGSHTVPTLNLDPDCEMTPQDGVYVTETRDLESGRCWRSVSNVGVRPTFGAGARVVETHLLDPLEADPPSRIEVTFLRRLREERTFASAPELKQQILQDIRAANRFFALRAALR